MFIPCLLHYVKYVISHMIYYAVAIVRVEYRMAHQYLQLRPPHDPRQNSLHHLQHKLQYLLLLAVQLVPIQPDGLIHMVMAANGMKLMTSLVVPAMVATGPTQQQVSLLVRLGKCLFTKCIPLVLNSQIFECQLLLRWWRGWW